MNTNAQFDIVIWMLVILISFSLFLPWISINIDSIEKIKAIKELLKEGPVYSNDTFLLSGYDIPIVSNSSGVKALTSIIKFFTGQRQELVLQSFLPLTIPFIAVICGLLGLLSVQGRIYTFLMIIISGCLGGVGLNKIYHANMNNLFVNVQFHVGLYIIFVSFCIIAFLGSLKLFNKPKR